MNRRFSYFLVSLSTILVALLLAGAVMGSNTNKAKDQEPYRHISVFTEVLSKIKSDYVEEPNMRSVTQGAINGLLESVDPFASYLNAEQYKEYVEKGKSPRVDVGLVLARRYGYMGVIDTLPGSSAAKAGLTTGDIIDSINHISTRDMPLAYADLLLQGKAGTSVELAVLHVRKQEPETISLIREPRKLPKVREELLEGSVGYINPYALNDGKVAEISAALKNLQKKGASKFVLDLRNCVLGDNAAGVQLADLFLDKGLITYYEGQKVAKKEFTADAAQTVQQPVVVLVNQGTAGAAEITASALLGNKRAEVVGQRTYGDAAVRQEIRMEDGGAVILSVAKYYTPDGKAIQDTGVIPTDLVSPYPQPSQEQQEPNEEEDQAAEPPALDPSQPLKPVEDLQLKKAIEILQAPADRKVAA